MLEVHAILHEADGAVALSMLMPPVWLLLGALAACLAMVPGKPMPAHVVVLVPTRGCRSCSTFRHDPAEALLARQRRGGARVEAVQSVGVVESGRTLHGEHVGAGVGPPCRGVSR